MGRKIVIFILLFVNFSLIVFTIYGQVKIRELERERQGKQVVPTQDIKFFDSKIEIISDVSGFTAKKGEIEKLSEILKEWRVFNGSNLFLYSLNQSVSPAKISYDSPGLRHTVPLVLR